MLPGVGKMQKQCLEAGMDGTASSAGRGRAHQFDDEEGTRNPQILQASRKRRIAERVRASTSPNINKLLKMHRQMSDMMKKYGQDGAART